MKKKLLLLVSAALVAGMFPVGARAQTTAAIQLLNPSDYSAAVELSTKQDRDNTYHFVAWVPSLPPNPIVEFEIQTAAGNSLRTIDANLVGRDTFEGFDTLAGLADGTYVVAARLYSNGVEVEGGTDKQPVTVRNGTLGQAETAEIVSPGNGDRLGFFNPKGLRPRALIDVVTSAGARQVRVLITTSRPGTDPEWVQCGTASASSQPVRVRCTVPEGTDPSAVTAIAAVANLTPSPTPAQGPADDAGDAHRVDVYAASPARVVISPEVDRAEVGTCREYSASVLDQDGRPLSGVNVDVHAQGPTDQLQFATGGNAMDFQAPDKGPHSQENAHQCGDLDPEERQGETNRIGEPDQKHIESRSDVTSPGTNNQGAFIFRLFSDTRGGTTVVAWADVDDDDVQQPSEASGGSRIGWGEEAPAALKQAFLDPGSASATVGSCQRFALFVKEGGNPASGQNADVHISSTDTAPSFCTPADASATRVPDQGEHVNGSHADGTQHIEGDLDFQGRLVFGVTAPSEGRVTVRGWLDENDDDDLSLGEPSAAGSVSFAISGDREVSFNTSRRRTAKGNRVRFYGEIRGAEACSDRQTVKLKARRPGQRFRTIKTKLTNGEGRYSWRFKVWRTKDYKVIAPREGVCDRDVSPTRRVRVRR